MDAGITWSGPIADASVEVEYSPHFVDRFEREEPGRPAPTEYMDEGEIFAAIQEALPDIAQRVRGEGSFQGVITSRAYGLNMSFVAFPQGAAGVRVVMKNMMLKAPFQPYRPYPGDVLFQVAGGDAELATAVADHVALAGAIRPGRFESPEAIYEVVLSGTRPQISKATWLFDTHIFAVH